MATSDTNDQRQRSVLFLHPSDEPYGADKVLLLLATGLQARGWRVGVLLSDDQPPGWLSEMLGRKGVGVQRGPLAPARRRYLTIEGVSTYVFSLLRARAWVRGRARSFKPAIIHVNTSSLLVAAFIGRPERAHLIWHVHELVSHPRVANWVFRLAPVLTATHVVAVSRAVRDHVSPRGFRRDRVSVVWNGIEDRPIVSVPDDGRPVVAFIGRLNRWKGWDVFLDATRRVAPRFPNARFLIAGDPPQGEEWRTADLLNQLSQLGIEDVVDVVGFEPDVPSLLDRVSILVNPAVWPEPFGMVTLEAMLAGRAVIATAQGGALDLITPGTTGLLVPPGDADALAAAIGTLLGDPALRSRLGIEARKRAQTNFTYDGFVAGVERAYLTVLGQGLGPL